MDDFKIIYRILKAIYVSMDYDEFDNNSISPEVLHVTSQKLDALLIMLIKDGMIEGFQIIPIAGGSRGVKMVGKPALTLKGLEYLEDNSMMKKAAKAVKGIVDVMTSTPTIQ